MESAVGSTALKVGTEVITEFPSSLFSFKKVQSLISTFLFSQKCDQEGEVLWFVVAVPTPETGSCPGRKRVEKGPSSTPCLWALPQTPLPQSGFFPLGTKGVAVWGLGVRETGRDSQASAYSGYLRMVHKVPVE